MASARISSIRLNAQFKPRKCEVCGKTFIPFSGRARKCDECRYSRHTKVESKGVGHERQAISKADMAFR